MIDFFKHIKVNALRQEGYQLFQNGLIELSRIEANGIRIDVPRLQKTKTDIKEKLRTLREELEQEEPWKIWRKIYGSKANLTSRDQLERVLHKEMGYKVLTWTETGRAQMNKEALQEIGLPFTKKLIRFFEYDKAYGTYLKGIEREIVGDRIHPSFNLHLARSFRSSCNDPNFQNMPIRDKEVSELVRGHIIPSVGNCLVENDFRGLEVFISACVTGDTLIQTIDGNQSIVKVIDRIKKGERVHVFSYDHSKQRVAVSEVTAGGRTKRKAEVWEVLLDNGEKIKATSDHSFLMRDGTYKPLKHLAMGDSLMPLYRKKKVSCWKTVYDQIYLNNGLSMMTHNLIALDVLGIQIAGSNLIIHHKDGVGTNNSLANLDPMTRKKHMAIHSKQGWKSKGRGKRHQMGWWDEEFGKMINEKRALEWTEKQWKEFGKRVSEGIKRSGGQGGSKNGMFGKHHTEETRSKISKTKKGVPSTVDPKRWKYISKKIQQARKKNGTNYGGNGYNKGVKLGPLSEARRKEISEFMKGRPFSKQSRKRLSKSQTKRWRILRSQDPQSICSICGQKMMTMGSHMRWKHPVVNHQVVSIRKLRSREDVYNLNVKGSHNYAVGAGVIIKNCYHQDPVFIKYIKGVNGEDMHKDMAIQIYKLEKVWDKLDPKMAKDIRYGAKNRFVFPQFYGDFYVACARNCWEWIRQGKLTGPDGESLYKHLKAKGITGLGKCDPDEKPKPGTFEAHMKAVESDFWERRFKVYYQWRRDWYRDYLDKGYFDLLTGFRVFGSFKRNAVVNYPVQGSAFHCLLWSLIRVNRILRKYKMRSMIVGQIHDSLVSDVRPKELRDFLEIVEQVTTVDLRETWQWITVPLEIEYEIAPEGANWFQKKEIKTLNDKPGFKNGRFLHPKDPTKSITDPIKFLRTLSV